MQVIFASILALLLFAGCIDKKTMDTPGIPAEETAYAVSGLSEDIISSCLVYKKLDNDMDCYEGEREAVKKQCEHIKKYSTQYKSVFSETSGCPVDEKYIGCCIEADYAQCYYLSDSYKNDAKMTEERISYLKTVCAKMGDHWKE